jgi:NADH-quinone oxidoreductase subunit L
MFDIKTLLILIPALPLAATLVTAALGPRVLRGRSHLPTVTALALSFIASILLVFQVQEQMERPAEHVSNSRGLAAPGTDPRPATIGYEQVITLWRWASLDNGINITLRADPLTAAMLAIVTCISALVAIYSIGYMHGDPGYWRFFTYISLFVFSMTMLVAASNFVVLYVFWEMVGLCSYLLIGFWFERPQAAAAGKKAFLVTRLGDCGFLLGLFLIWTTYGTLNFHDTWIDGQLVMGVLGQARLASPGSFVGGGLGTAIGLLLLLGACGKSAQFPLHVWLPDAMEGPSPVSALIHAATMVTAGVYLIARCTPLMAASPDAQCVVAVIGGLTALLGGIIAITQTDLKRILAYSTISHLGYMFLALGTGTLLGVTAAMFHLLTHAFFKALLFLGAGSVMHAMGGVIDIRRLGGLRRRMPTTHWTFLVGCLAIAGVFPFAGFWSKDAILLAVQHRLGQGNFGEIYETLFGTAMLGILLIDFYMFRPFFLTFYGPERIPPEAGGHAHESPGVMTVPLLVLAFGATVVGAYFEAVRGFAPFLAGTPSLAYLPPQAPAAAEAAGHVRMGVTSTIITTVGIAAAAAIYLGTTNGAARLARLMNVFGLYTLSYAKFFFDPLYTLLVVRPLLGLARLAALFDQYVIDGLVDLCGRLPKLAGQALRPTQNGLVQFYAMMMMIGLFVLLGALLM